MAVSLISNTPHYLGLAGDTKPASAPAGATFFETDTKLTYRSDGSAWSAITPFATKTVAFTGAAGLGAVGSVSLFTVTGEVIIERIVPFCTEDLVGATATLALGITGSTALFIAATTATDIDVSEFWTSATPSANGVAIPAALKDIIITDNIIGTVATANITDGTIRFDVYWRPLSGGSLVAA